MLLNYLIVATHNTDNVYTCYILNFLQVASILATHSLHARINSHTNWLDQRRDQSTEIPLYFGKKY